MRRTYDQWAGSSSSIRCGVAMFVISVLHEEVGAFGLLLFRHQVAAIHPHPHLTLKLGARNVAVKVNLLSIVLLAATGEGHAVFLSLEDAQADWHNALRDKFGAASVVRPRTSGTSRPRDCIRAEMYCHASFFSLARCSVTSCSCLGRGSSRSPAR